MPIKIKVKGTYDKTYKYFHAALTITSIQKLKSIAEKALEKLKEEDSNKYNSSIILMTDGQANQGTFSELASKYKEINKEIPIYSILFGEASISQLQDIADLTNAKVFNGKTDLVKAFKEVRGYN